MTLLLLAQVSESTEQSEALGEIISVLTPFEEAGTITPKGSVLLAWARDPTG